MSVRPVFYAPPRGRRHRLTATPALASWDRAGSPGQLRSAAFIDEVHRVVAGDLGGSKAPLGLSLEVGLPSTASLTALHDLDNYLFPLVPKLTELTGHAFASVRATKSRRAESWVTAGPVEPTEPSGASYSASIITTASASTTAFKEQIRDQLVGAEVIPGLAVRLELSFVVGPRRAWPNLWKATIDSLGALLGRDHGASEWNARDGRIVDLAMHCSVDPTVGNDVHLWIRADSSDDHKRWVQQFQADAAELKDEDLNAEREAW